MKIFSLPINADFLKKHISLFMFLLLTVVGVLAYANSFNTPFEFDDRASITENTSIQSGLNFKEIWKHDKTRFLIAVSFAVNWQLGGADPFGYHLVNFMIHVFSSFIVFCLLLTLFETPRMARHPLQTQWGIPVFASLMFMAHPVQTQAVTYVCQRASSLGALLYLLTVLFYVLWRVRNRRLFYAGALIATFLAMFIKENMITLPLMLVCLEFLFFNQSKPAAEERIFKLIPFLAMLAVVPLTYSAQLEARGITSHSLTEETSLIGRTDYLITQINVIRTYVRILFLPVNQAIDYGYPISKSILETKTFLSLLFLATLAILGFRTWKTRPLLSFGILWFFLTLSVESSLIPIKDVIFEHRLYLPMFGFAMVVCSEIYTLTRRPVWAGVALGAIMLVFAVCTYQRNKVWQDPVSLWLDSATKYPHGYRSHYNLGKIYYGRGEMDLAIPHFQKAIQSRPFNVIPYNELGLSYLAKNQYDLAIEQFEKAMALKPKAEALYHNMGVAFYKKGNYPKAKSLLNTALDLNPDFSRSHFVLGVYAARRCELEEAVSHFDAVINMPAGEPFAKMAQEHLLQITSLAGSTLEEKKQGCKNQKLFDELETLEELRKITQITRQTKPHKIWRLHPVYNPRRYKVS